MNTTNIICLESTMMHDNDDSSVNTVLEPHGTCLYEDCPYDDYWDLQMTESFDDDYDYVDDFSISSTGKGGWRSDKGTSLATTRKKQVGKKSIKGRTANIHQNMSEQKNHYYPENARTN
eukprot:CAMPEP_0170860136 /NCGR_PEP_ID=MMETSP0734-20130129/17244_1 /TAXON_ID=186038 /ORGANISM="Fragilariopsis kerguelensis, Strain L26-C5" /LENGTH=118 /DNA_ID=CAMNT_0011233579 /DNA_START=76 /DNA_END=433 /DNA_ORIENTATION=-